MTQKLELKITKDGSHTLFNPAINETYHTLNGAIAEADYVYIQRGLKEITKSKKDISVFELGFGTGLNAILTIIDAIENNYNLTYHCIDSNILEIGIIDKLNYFQFMDNQYRSLFHEIHKSQWNSELMLKESITFKKINSKVEDYISDKQYDIIYFDAFAPSRQSEIWEDDIISKISEMLNDNGLIVTYSSTSKFSKQLKSRNLSVEKLPGFCKREMTRAWK